MYVFGAVLYFTIYLRVVLLMFETSRPLAKVVHNYITLS